MSKSYISDWAQKINWEKRVKSVCKPCWEIKYCPYGPLVEQFPLQEDRNDKSCVIFGHDCPVFYVAEPFTETKELRRITRAIPRIIQYKVLRRENHICSNCGQPVKDNEIEFDHIIPWSKGGPTEEHNIRLLCSNCNKKKGNRLEKEHLISNGNEHYTEPYDIGIIEFVIMAIAFGHDFIKETGEFPTGKDFADRLNDGELTIAENSAAEMFKDLNDFFKNKKPRGLKTEDFKFLKLRWGFIDSQVRYIQEACNELNFNVEYAVNLDKYIMNLLGLRIKEDKVSEKKWKKL
jgi:hypothetical protein